MNLREIEILLTLLVLPLLIIFLTTFARNQRDRLRRRTHPANKLDKRFDYGFEKQYDQLGQPVVYECLLRHQNFDDTWSLLPSLNLVTLRRTLDLLTNTSQQLAIKPHNLAINLNYAQLMSPDFPYFIRWAVTKVTPMKLVIEFELPRHLNWFKALQLKHRLYQTRRLGVTFCVDNVSIQRTDIALLKRLISNVTAVKYVLTVPPQSQSPLSTSNPDLTYWQHFTAKYQLQLVLAGINTLTDQLLAEQANVSFRQVQRVLPID